jgi:hypothetical protein
MRFTLAVIFVITVSVPAWTTDLTNKELAAACGNKTLVYSKQGERVGEKIDGFCSGYLQATFSALVNSASCKASDQSSEFLLSVYQSYVKEKNVSASDSASKTLTQAFRRAADCK